MLGCIDIGTIRFQHQWAQLGADISQGAVCGLSVAYFFNVITWFEISQVCGDNTVSGSGYLNNCSFWCLQSGNDVSFLNLITDMFFPRNKLPSLGESINGLLIKQALHWAEGRSDHDAHVSPGNIFDPLSVIEPLLPPCDISPCICLDGLWEHVDKNLSEINFVAYLHFPFLKCPIAQVADFVIARAQLPKLVPNNCNGHFVFINRCAFFERKHGCDETFSFCKHLNLLVSRGLTIACRLIICGNFVSSLSCR
mmetsp:Transcript_83443/g.165619  ORF Transcript_83443/g.165619 Transcript_83443/m.165619 type:complete len:253 (-) Transcript_83443:1806-2564(-)